MSSAVLKLFEQASGLGDKERAELADLLIASLKFSFDPRVKASWHREIRRRSSEIDHGTTKTIPWEQVAAKIDTILDAKKEKKRKPSH